MNIIEARILAMACKFKLILEQTMKEESRLVHIIYDGSIDKYEKEMACHKLERIKNKLKMLEVLQEIGLDEIAGEWE